MDRNFVVLCDDAFGERCPLRGGVDRNCVEGPGGGGCTGCPLRGGVDRNFRLSLLRILDPVAPCAGAWIETVKASRSNPNRPCCPLRGGVDRNVRVSPSS